MNSASELSRQQHSKALESICTFNAMNNPKHLGTNSQSQPKQCATVIKVVRISQKREELEMNHTNCSYSYIF